MAAAPKKKKKFKLTLKYDITKYNKTDFTKDAADIVNGDKDLSKYVKPLEFKVDAELDERKWNPKKLEEEAYYGFRMAVKIFDQQVKKCKKDGKLDGVKKAYDELEKQADFGFEKWLKDVESGKADNADALKKGKAAMNKLDAFKSNSFDDPRKGVINALKSVTKDKPDPKDIEKAKTAISTIQGTFEKSGKEAQTAVDFLMKNAKKMQDDKDADASLKEFGKKVLAKEKDVFGPFLDEADKFSDAIDEAIELTEAKEFDVKKAKDLLKTFEGLTGLEKAAAAAVREANKLKPEFKKIESKLK